MMINTIDALNWRYATKQFDPTRTLTPEQEHVVLETFRFSPSSYGLEPSKCVVIKNPEIRKRLREEAGGQPQFTDSSLLMVLCSLRTMDEKYVQTYIERIAQVRQIPLESLDGFKKMMLGFIGRLSPEQLKQWMQHQTYLALGMVLATCAMNEIDACPMEGFDSKKFNEVLELHKYGVESTVLCAIGFRMPDDPASKSKKVRPSEEELVIHVD
ncbi:MAG: NAD(P)H-dependent oxidoreductase [Candidatus Kerfeldbacteria bacterium]|nr:NAD(P)H-dependent oxidoreductase [Candidatus Kerfeldbacteria bacterium]